VKEEKSTCLKKGRKIVVFGRPMAAEPQKGKISAGKAK